MMTRGYRPPLPVIERLERKSIVDGDCRRWTGVHDGDGYGRMRVGSRTDGTRRLRGVHQLAYEHFHGPIPEGQEVHHSCFVRDCWQPEHLRATTHRENCQDRTPEAGIKASQNLALARSVRWAA